MPVVGTYRRGSRRSKRADVGPDANNTRSLTLREDRDPGVADGGGGSVSNTVGGVAIGGTGATGSIYDGFVLSNLGGIPRPCTPDDIINTCNMVIAKHQLSAYEQRVIALVGLSADAAAEPHHGATWDRINSLLTFYLAEKGIVEWPAEEAGT
jgi:hypothetical protein